MSGRAAELSPVDVAQLAEIGRAVADQTAAALQVDIVVAL